MDILQAYEKEQSKAKPKSLLLTQEQLLKQRYASDTGLFIRLVMKLSEGRIQDARSASIVLLVFAMIVIVASLFLFFRGDAAKFSPDWTPYASSSDFRPASAK